MIKEANITYTPEKIDEFIVELAKELETAKSIYETALGRIKGMSIGDIIENLATAQAYKDKLTKAHNAISKQHTKYFDIIEMYDVDDMPKNVRQLEKLVDKLDEYSSDILKVEDVLDDILSATERLTNTYSD